MAGMREALWWKQAVLQHPTTDVMRFMCQVAVRGRQSLPSPDVCFSLVCDDRTLDFAAESPEEAKAWVNAIRLILDQVHGEEDLLHSARSTHGVKLQ